jgi:hypothetical protein
MTNGIACDSTIEPDTTDNLLIRTPASDPLGMPNV